MLCLHIITSCWLSDPNIVWALYVQVVVPASIVVQPSSTASLDVAYRPLLAAESAATLKLTSKELGLYQYALRLKGAPAGPERSMAFSVALGNTETQVGGGRCRQQRHLAQALAPKTAQDSGSGVVAMC